MKTLAITGATDGMGRALALTYLERGDAVVAVGRSAEKGRALRAAAEQLGARERLTFVQADLSLLSETERVAAEMASKADALDALVLCARHFRTTRLVTSEGLEHTLAHFTLSRHLLAERLLGLLERAERPVIVNVAGPGAPAHVFWDDLQLERGYDGAAALQQGGPLNDLLGASFAERHADARTRYVLVNPGPVASSVSGEYDATTAPHVEMLKRMGKPVAQAIRPVVATIDDPPAAPLSALVDGRPLGVDSPAFDAEAARHLHGLLEQLLARAAG